MMFATGSAASTSPRHTMRRRLSPCAVDNCYVDSRSYINGQGFQRALETSGSLDPSRLPKTRSKQLAFSKLR